MLWISMASMAMVFAGLTSAYVVRRAEGDWMEFALPDSMYYATGILALSSITMILAQRAFKFGKSRMGSIYLLGTFILGIGFLIAQYFGWDNLIGRGIYFTGEDFNAAGGFLYVLTFVHICHLIGGLIAVLVTWIKSLRGAYSAENMLGVELTGIFWHFLDILWIYLFLFLLFIR